METCTCEGGRENLCLRHSLSVSFGVSASDISQRIIAGGLPTLSHGFDTLPEVCAYIGKACLDGSQHLEELRRLLGFCLARSVDEKSVTPMAFEEKHTQRPQSASGGTLPNYTSENCSGIKRSGNKALFDLLSFILSMLNNMCVCVCSVKTKILSSSSFSSSSSSSSSSESSSSASTSASASSSTTASSYFPSLYCRCPKTCPVFTLRLMNCSPILLTTIFPLLFGLESPGPRLVAMLLWRLYHLAQVCAPFCARFAGLHVLSTTDESKLSYTKPLQNAGEFWDKTLRGLIAGAGEDAFAVILELMIDRTNPSNMLPVDLFGVDVKYPQLLTYAFEALRALPLESKVEGLKNINALLQTRMCNVVPIYYPLVSANRELGPLRLLSDLQLEAHSRASASGDIEHYCISYLKSLLRYPLRYWPGTSFASTFRRVLSIIDAFGPPSASHRRVKTMRHLFIDLLQSISKDPHTIATAVNAPGETLWANIVQLTSLVLQFVLAHGYLAPQGWDHVPQPSELAMSGSMLPAPPQSNPLAFRDVQSDYFRPWNHTLGAQLRLHTRCGLQGEAHSVVLEDGELLKELSLALREIKWHRYEVGLSKTHEKCYKAANEVYNLVATLLAVFVGTGYGLGSSTLPSPRTPIQIRKGDLPPSPRLGPVVSELEEKLRVAKESITQKVVAGLKSVLNDRTHESALAYLSLMVNEPQEGFAADSLEVLMEGWFTRCYGSSASNERKPCLVQLTGTHLRYMLGAGTTSSAMLRWAREAIPQHQRKTSSVQSNIIPLQTITSLKVLPPETRIEKQQTKTSLNGNSNHFSSGINDVFYSVLISSKYESFVIGTTSEEHLREWVGVISIVISRVRFEARGQGNVLKGLQVFVSEQFAGKMDTLFHFRDVYLASSLSPLASSHFTASFSFLEFGEANPLFLDEVGCLGCSHSFTLVTRRHHCRRCGHSFCGKCSSKRHKVHVHEFRVCNMCFDTLLEREALLFQLTQCL